MLSVPIFNTVGDQLGTMDIDPAVLGGAVRVQLIKQAIVAFLDHQRHFSARTKGRSQVVGSGRKLYRQKGTGNARAGNIRTPLRRGGGCTFAKRGVHGVKRFPKKMRRLARDSAILAKIQAQEVVILDDLVCTEPKTKPFASMLTALGVHRGCLLALDERNENVYRSGRNVPDTDIRLVEELNAYEVWLRPKVIFTKRAFERLVADPVKSRGESSGE